MNFNVNFNVLLSKYIVHPLVKIKDFDNVKSRNCKNEMMKTKCGQHYTVSETAGSHSNDMAL